jgi:hypothetical protein
MPGSRRPTGAVLQQRLDGQDRGGLGDAVALHDAHAETITIEPAGCLAQPLGADDHHADRVEIVGMGEAGPAGEERVGGENDGGVAVVDDLRHDPVVQRRRVEEGPHAAEHRQQRAGGEPEAVKHRQGGGDAVGRAEVERPGKLGAIGQQVAMAEQHGFRRALRPAGEQHNGGLTGRNASAGQGGGP